MHRGEETMGAKKEISHAVTFQPFEHLRDMIETRGKRMSPVPTAPARKKSSDEELFRDAMKEVREIAEFRKIPFRCRGAAPVSKDVSRDDDSLNAVAEIVRGRRPLNLPDTQEYVEWVNPSYKADIVRKLHEGRFSVQDCLDLHGLILEEAKEEADAFLAEALKKRLRCVKIIHGRGLRSPSGPVLKEALIKWLICHHRKKIIAFVTARQCDGGLGALYILLK
jgi:DNA-nicking Smr family endonuclease